MSEELQLQWTCPYCFRSFPTASELRSHLEAGRVHKILAEIRKTLHQTCGALDDVLNHKKIDKESSQCPETSTELRLAKPFDLTCPHVDCKDTERVIYTKKPNLFRHYQTHIACDAKCPSCDATFSHLRQWVKHFYKCKKKLNGRHTEASRVKRDLCQSASEQLDQQLEARAALQLRRKEDFSESANAMHNRPRKRQRTEKHSAAGSDESDPGISVGPQGESTTDFEQMNYAVYPVHPDGWAGSVFAAERVNQNRLREYGSVPVHPDGCTGAVFAGVDPGMYATIPVHPDLWLQSVFSDDQSGVAQTRTEHISGFPDQNIDWLESVFDDGSSSKTALGTI